LTLGNLRRLGLILDVGVLVAGGDVVLMVAGGASDHRSAAAHVSVLLRIDTVLTSKTISSIPGPRGYTWNKRAPECFVKMERTAEHTEEDPSRCLWLLLSP
jgi:hypothetical protein